MRVLVTGSSGFIGSNLCDFLRDKRHQVYEVDKSNRREPVDIRNFEKLRRVFSKTKPDVVFHLAALASMQAGEENPFEAYSTNVIGTLNVIECANKFDAKIIFTSSAAVYGETKIVPTLETAPLSPINVYGATKVAAEQLIGLRAKKSAIFRLFNVYGPKCRRSYVIPDVVRKISERQNPLKALGTGEERRDFVYIDDVIKAFMLNIEKDAKGIFNVGTGKPICIKDLIKNILDTAGFKTKIMFAGSTRRGDFSCNWADIDKIKSELGWQPETTLEEGLKKTIEWYNKPN